VAKRERTIDDNVADFVREIFLCIRFAVVCSAEQARHVPQDRIALSQDLSVEFDDWNRGCRV
jgi:hypothetical protein